MPSPFPGMDPYLENPRQWPNVHHNFISDIQGQLNARLRPRYLARIEERVYVETGDDPARKLWYVPDVQVGRKGKRNRARNGAVTAVAEPLELATTQALEIREARLKIVDTAKKRVIAIIEVISPANKIPGATAHAEYMKKRVDILGSPAHWVEIDLLRAGTPIDDRWGLDCDYVVHVSPADRRPIGRVWPIHLREHLPVITVPLGKGESCPLDLQAMHTATYERGAFDIGIDYTRPPESPLSPTDAAWADTLLRRAGLRRRRRRS
jgi:hypothetical protein